MRTAWVTEFLFKAKDVGFRAFVGKASLQLQDMGKAADQGADKFKALAGAYTSWLVARRGIEMAKGFVKPALEMEKAQFRIRMLTAASKNEMIAFGKAAKEAAERTEYGPKIALDALAKLRISAGSTGAAVANLNTVLQLAQLSAGKMAPEVAAERFGTLIKAFGMTGQQAREAGDQMFHLGRKIGVPAAEIMKIADKLSQAQILHGTESFTGVLKTMAIALRGMPRPERAATRFMRMISQFTTRKVQEDLKRLGVTVMDYATGRLKPLQEIMVQLANVDAVRLRHQLAETWDKRNVQILVSIIGQLRDRFRDSNGEALRGAAIYDHLDKVLRDSTGTVKKAGDEYLKLASTSLRRVQENFWILLATLGQNLLPALDILGRVVIAIAKAFDYVASSPIVGWILRFSMRLLGFITIVKLLRVGFWGVAGVLKAVQVYMVRLGVQSMDLGFKLRYAQARAAGFGRVLSVLKSTILSVKGALIGLGIGILTFLPEIIELVGSWFDDKTDKAKKVQDDMAKTEETAARKAAELREKSGGVLNDYMQIGTKRMNDVIDRLEGIGKYRIQVADVNLVAQRQRYLQRFRPATEQQELARRTGLAQIQEFKRLADMAAAGKITAPKAARGMLGTMITLQGAMNKLLLEQKVGKEAMNRNLDKFEKEVITPMVKGLKQSPEWTAMMARMGGGRTQYTPGQPYSYIPGYSAAQGMIVAPGEQAKGLQDLAEAVVARMLGETPAEGGMLGVPKLPETELIKLRAVTETEKKAREEEALSLQQLGNEHLRIIREVVEESIANMGWWDRLIARNAQQRVREIPTDKPSGITQAMGTIP